MVCRRCAVALLALAACQAPAPGPFAAAVSSASKAYGVPAEILQGIAWEETHFAMRPGEASLDRGYGPMHLVEGRSLDTGARKAGVSVAEATTRLDANLAAGAALLRAGRDARTSSGGVQAPDSDLVSWYMDLRAFARESGLSSDAAQTLFADEVFATLERGADATVDGERIVLLPIALGAPTKDGYDSSTAFLSPDGFPGAHWVESPNWNTRSGVPLDTIVIHDTEGSYSGTISWFLNTASQVSAHYVVRSSDGDVTQMVREDKRAWHASCWNSRSLGIEHEGFRNQTGWYTEAMYVSSAKLSSWMANKWGIPKDRGHFRGHEELTDCNNHSDPGPNWDWAHYMDLVVNGGNPPPPPLPDLDIHVAIGDVNEPGQARDFEDQGASKGIFDLFEGEEVTEEIVVSNGAGGAVTDAVVIGFWVEEPWLVAKSYTILTNWDGAGGFGTTFQPSDANAVATNPPHEAPGQTGYITINPLSPKETKKIVFTLRAARYSVGASDHPDLRAWVRHVGDYYGEQLGWDQDPAVNKAGKKLQAYAQSDVWGRDHFEWNGDAAEPEGFAASGAASLAVDPASHALSIEMQGAAPGATGSRVRIDAARSKGIALRVASPAAAAGRIRFLTADDRSYDDAKSARFAIPAGGAFADLAVDLSKNARWTGTVIGLRLEPAAEGTGTVKVDFLRALPSVSGTSGGDCADADRDATGVCRGAPPPEPGKPSASSREVHGGCASAGIGGALSLLPLALRRRSRRRAAAPLLSPKLRASIRRQVRLLFARRPPPDDPEITLRLRQTSDGRLEVVE